MVETDTKTEIRNLFIDNIIEIFVFLTHHKGKSLIILEKKGSILQLFIILYKISE